MSPFDDIPDRATVPPGFTAAYSAHREDVLAVVRRILPYHDAEEVVHEAFLGYFLHPERHDATRGTLLTYLRMAARGRAIDRLRSSEAARQRDTVWTADATTAFDEGTHDRREEIVDALRLLHPLHREAIVTAFFGRLTYAEAATSLGVPEGTLKSRIRTGLAQLRDLLGPAFAGASLDGPA